MMYLLDRSRRPRLLRPARFKKRGGRANRRRCARWRRFPSDCRVQPHSNMGRVVLCRNFSGEASVSRSLQTREIRRSRPTTALKAKYADGLRRAVHTRRLSDWTVSMFGRGRLNLKQTWNDNLPGATAARWGGCMLYGISAVLDQLPFSGVVVSDDLDVTSARPPERAPDRPLSTR